MHRFLPFVVIIAIFSFSCKKHSQPVTYSNGPTDSLKLNQISILASHNSYHLKTDTAVFNYILSLYNAGIITTVNPNQLDYTHAPLTEQLTTYGIRGLELDVWNDPNGGNYYNRQGYFLTGRPAASNIPALQKPGFKLLHIPDIDFISSQLTFVDALTEIKAWSDAHPNHIPLFINVETEVAALADIIGTAYAPFAAAVPFDATAADNLDLEVKSVFGPDLKGVITPDDVRGSYATLEQAVLAGNWPQLAKARGKVVFIVNGDGSSGDVYMTGHPSLQNRVMFVYTNTGRPEAAFVLKNGPKSDFTSIQQNAAKGYIVRTMSDDATTQARAGDYTQMNAAFGSWAQIVSTDYYRPDPRAGTTGWSDYHVALPGGNVGRIDSISATSQLNLGAIKE